MIQYELNLKEYGKHIKKFANRIGGEKILEARFPWYLNPPPRDPRHFRDLMTAFRHLGTHRGPGISGMAGSVPGQIQFLAIREYGKEVMGLEDDSFALNYFQEAILAIDEQYLARQAEKIQQKRHSRPQGANVEPTETTT